MTRSVAPAKTVPAKTFALALGGGGARGLAHIAVLEALDEMGQKPVAIAGTSIGSLIGAAYAAGMSGKDIRRFVVALAHDRTEVFRRLIATRASTFANLFNIGFGSATLVDAEKFCVQFLPDQVPDDFGALEIPLTIIATDLYRRRQTTFSSGALKPALAASIALPTVMRPVVVEDRVLIDGGATNPLPFDLLRGRADIVIAVDISGEPMEERRDIPNPWECLLNTVLVMGNAITAEKVKHGAPDLIVRPRVGAFRTLDFLQASAILRASEPVKAELKEKLKALLAA
jgi:NTE family protein